MADWRRVDALRHSLQETPTSTVEKSHQIESYSSMWDRREWIIPTGVLGAAPLEEYPRVTSRAGSDSEMPVATHARGDLQTAAHCGDRCRRALLLKEAHGSIRVSGVRVHLTPAERDGSS
jgi:hypothetical protein